VIPHVVKNLFDELPNDIGMSAALNAVEILKVLSCYHAYRIQLLRMPLKVSHIV